MPSTVVKRFSYDTASGTLRVVFLSGLVYDYKNVPEHVYVAMKAATSKGRFLNAHIKTVYDFEKVSDID